MRLALRQISEKKSDALESSRLIASLNALSAKARLSPIQPTKETSPGASQ
jgi:hypothetical protein